MRSDKPDFSELFLIMDVGYHAIPIVHDLKPRQAFSCIRMFFSELV
jgi:hypothetical protein